MLRVTVWLSELVTIVLTTPAECEGELHVSDVDEVTETDVHELPPIVTVAPVTNPVPVIVRGVDPAVVPLVGLTDVIVGAA